MTVKICLVTDSRGGFFKFFLDRLNDNVNVEYDVLVLKGRKLEELWLRAKEKIITGECERAYIWGGICNLTSPYYYNGRRSFWPLKNVEELTLDLTHILNGIVNEILHLGLYGKISFLPETGINLLAYNRVDCPMGWMLQCHHDISVNIPFLYSAFRNANARLGCTTPWIIDSVYGRNRQGLLYLKHNKLYDGLHPAPCTASDMVKKIIRNTNRALKC